MAKTNNESNGFSIPTTELAKADSRESERDWMKRVAKAHGDTDPLKLEKRREKVSTFAALAERGLGEMQTVKKMIIAQHDQREKQLRQLRSKHADGTPEAAAIDQQIIETENSKNINVMQQQIAISQHTAMCALTEVLCLTVDSLTIREEVKSKSGKKGLTRYSIAHIMDSQAFDTGRIYKRLRKMHTDMLSTNPLLAGKEDNEDEPETTEEEFALEEDILTEEEREGERKNARKIVGEEA